MKKFKLEEGTAVKDTPYAKMFIQDGILHFYYKEINNMTLEMAKECVKSRLVFTNYQSYPCLVDFVQLKNSTKEARDYFADQGNDGIIANAILVNSSVFKMMANFYVMVNKPKNPTRLFTDKDAALEWLEKYK